MDVVDEPADGAGETHHSDRNYDRSDQDPDRIHIPAVMTESSEKTMRAADLQAGRSERGAGADFSMLSSPPMTCIARVLCEQEKAAPIKLRARPVT